MTTTTYVVTFQPADHDDSACPHPVDVCDYRLSRVYTTKDQAREAVNAAKRRGDRDIWMTTTTTRRVKQ